MIDYDKLMLLMKSKGLTQDDLAATADVSLAWFYQIKHGSDVRLKTVCRVADALGVPINALIKQKAGRPARAEAKYISKYVLRKKLSVEMALAKRIEKKYGLKLNKVDSDKPEFKDLRMLAENIWEGL